MKRPTLEALNQLERLSRSIRDTQKSATQIVQAAKAKCHEAVAESILCGHALNAAKELVGEDFQQWLSKHFPNLPASTAERFMKLANYAHDNEDRIGISVRQACIFAGIVEGYIPSGAGIVEG